MSQDTLEDGVMLTNDDYLGASLAIHALGALPERFNHAGRKLFKNLASDGCVKRAGERK